MPVNNNEGRVAAAPVQGRNWADPVQGRGWHAAMSTKDCSTSPRSAPTEMPEVMRIKEIQHSEPECGCRNIRPRAAQTRSTQNGKIRSDGETTLLGANPECSRIAKLGNSFANIQCGQSMQSPSPRVLGIFPARSRRIVPANWRRGRGIGLELQSGRRMFGSDFDLVFAADAGEASKAAWVQLVLQGRPLRQEGLNDGSVDGNRAQRRRLL